MSRLIGEIVDTIGMTGTVSEQSQLVGEVAATGGGGGIIPSGTKTITAAGITDVTTYARVDVPSAELAINTPSINSSGLVTASASLSSAGWQGSAPADATLQLTTQAAATITPSANEQTAVSSGKYTTDIVKVAPVPTESKTITTNGTHNAPSGKWWNSVVVNVPSSQPLLQDKTVTANGTVTADSGYDGLGTVTVNVPTGSDRNIQFNASMQQSTATALSSTGLSLTVAKSGIYNISWMAALSSNIAASTRLYVDGNARDTERATWTNTAQQTVITNFALSEGQTVEIYARVGNARYFCMVGNLIIAEQ